MVNYLYRLGDLERNHEAYTRDYEIAAASEIESLAKRKAPRPATAPRTTSAGPRNTSLQAARAPM